MYRIFFIILFIPEFTYCQKMTTEDYIKKYKDIAIENMKLKKVPASITLAQGILESGNGNSKLATEANNHFGIKCHKGWNGGTFYQDDDAPNECFRKYKSVLESYKDHADFLNGRERYKGLFDLKITDYKGWAHGLKAAGYATNPKYADQLISLIERYKLYQYDLESENSNIIVENNTKDEKNRVVNTIKEPISTNFQIIHINGLKAVKVSKGQTKDMISNNFEIKINHLEKYNELGATDDLYEGQIIFIEPKRNSAASGNDYHIVKEGETFYSIAHSYGMKTEALMKKNKKWYASIIKQGDKLWLRKTLN